ncbi:MAG: hypothetical protein BroJett015_30380 [Chloroflexota bacterium]|nr:MAG: hypothetical protein BroJett015_30380 [Chloroflexota bacterium]
MVAASHPNDLKTGPSQCGDEFLSGQTWLSGHTSTQTCCISQQMENPTGAIACLARHFQRVEDAGDEGIGV